MSELKSVKYMVLATSEDKFTAEKGDNAGQTYDCRYIVIKKTDNVKPIPYKATESALNSAKKLRDKEVLLAFDEHGRINGIAEDKSETPNT